MTNPAAVEDLRSMERLPFKTVAGYGAGDLAFNLAFSLSTAFLLYYYTDVAGISAAAVGTMFLVVRLWDAFADLFAGRLVDRTMTRWGKFRPFIMFGAVPLLFMSFLTFNVPSSFDAGMKLAYAYATYAVLGSGLLAGEHPLRLAGLGRHPVGARAGQAGLGPGLRRRYRRGRPDLRGRRVHRRPARPRRR